VAWANIALYVKSNTNVTSYELKFCSVGRRPIFIVIISFSQDIAIAAMGPIQGLPDYNWFRRRTYMLRY
jgi:hypothetical protein